MSGWARQHPDEPEHPGTDLDCHDEEHDVWGNRGKPSADDLYGKLGRAE